MKPSLHCWIVTGTDLPTRLYLTVLVQKSVDSADVRAYFLKYEQFPESMEIAM